MKARTLFLTLPLFLFAALACTKEQSKDMAQTDTVTHRIPVETALASLEEFLDAEGTASTKAGISRDRRQVKGVDVVRAQSLGTKAGAADVDCDELLYVVNFENDEGYAILAADDRIQEDILMVADSGNISASSVSSSTTGSCRRIFDDYPLTGPGVETDEDGNLYMNPNTFSLYDEDSGEYLVGDLTLEGGYLPESGGSSSSGSSGKPKLDTTRILGPISDYAAGQVSGSGGVAKFRGGDDDSDGGSGSSTYTRTRTTIVYDTLVHPMLTFAKGWTQDSPFNDRLKTVYKRKNGQRLERKADAGCVTLAVAKILSFYEHPYNIYCGAGQVSTHILKTEADTSPTFKSQSAILIEYIAHECGSSFFYDGTFTFPFRAKNFLKDVGYQNVDYKSYSTDAVLSCLKNSVPVFVCSIPQTERKTYDLKACHAWMIDGYWNRIKKTTVSRYEQSSNKLLSSGTSSVSNTMVHCDFGWGGKCNGYFTSGIFNLADSNNRVFDPDSAASKSTNYKWYLKMITYDNPKK